MTSEVGLYSASLYAGNYANTNAELRTDRLAYRRFTRFRTQRTVGRRLGTAVERQYSIKCLCSALQSYYRR